MTNLKSIDSGLVFHRGFRPRCSFHLGAVVLTTVLVWSSNFGGNAEVKAQGTLITAILHCALDSGYLEAKFFFSESSATATPGDCSRGAWLTRGFIGPNVIARFGLA